MVENSGLEMKYSKDAIDNASENNIAVFKWWKNSGLAFDYDESYNNFILSTMFLTFQNTWKLEENFGGWH